MPQINRRHAAIATIAAALVAAVVTSSGANAAPPSGQASFTVPHSAPAWAKAGRALGTVGSQTKITFSMALPLRNAGEAERIADTVSDPASATYGHYLTPSEFNSRFGPTDAQVSKIKAYLRSQGFAVGDVAAGNRWVTATGTVAQINQAFGVTMRNYRYHGKSLRAPDSAVTLPDSLRGMVLGISGLDNGGLLRQPASRRVDPSGGKSANSGLAPKTTPPPASTCSTYWGQHTQTAPQVYGSTTFPTYICGYSPAQVRGAYGVPAGHTGAGVTVAIIDAYASSTMASDADKYSTAMSEPTFTTGQYREQVFTPFTLTSECGESGWNGEETLDVEAVHAMAPKANILYIGAQNCDTGIDDAINWVIQNHAASIISNSWGSTGEGNLGSSYVVEKSMFLQAKAQGMGFYFSSGDNGDNATYPYNSYNTPQPDYPASDANVTAVGGTSLAINASAGYMWETSWGTYIDPTDYSISPAGYQSTPPGQFWGGAGGGVSTVTTQPSYQVGVVPNSLATLNGPTPMRVVPDVSAVADPYTGFAVGQTVNGVWSIGGWGGTSLACPIFAAVQAIVQQERGVPIGFANPLLYQIDASSFHDVVAPDSTVAIVTPSGGTLVTFADDTSLIATSGYDDVTGRGSPIVPRLIASEGSKLHLGSLEQPPSGWKP